MTGTPVFLLSGEAFRCWLEKNHAREREFWIGFHKRHTGKKSISWPEAVDEALCFGWIDGVRKSIDENRYMIRMTPRKPSSTWSRINIKRVGELVALGRMTPAGLSAFEKRQDKKSGIYSYENAPAEFDAAMTRTLKANQKAAAFFHAQAPWYQRTAKHWVVRAKREETRARRLEQLIRVSANGLRLPQFSRTPTKEKG